MVYGLSLAPSSSTSSFTKEEKEVSLDGVHVAARITDTIAEVQVVQFYYNTSASSIDAIYTFPLDEAAAICGFECELNDRLLVGQVKEKNDAQKEYIAAKSRGESASLLVQDKPDVFSQHIANIPARSRINIRITYVCELKLEIDNSLRFVLPMHLAPRYTPSEMIPWKHPWGSYTTRCNWTSAFPMTTATVNPSAFSVDIAIEMPSPIRNIASPSGHIIQVLAQNTVQLSSPTAPMDRDFVLSIETTKPLEPRALVEVAADGSCFTMLTMAGPHLSIDPVQAEITFLVDCSGSMEDGSKMDAAKRAMRLFVKSLPSTCCFDIINFGTSFDSLFPGQTAQPYTAENLARAEKWIQNTDAKMGGTQILEPLNAIFTDPFHDTSVIKQRQVFVLTDGEVNNVEAIKALCTQHSARNRIFTVGIGKDVSHALVEGMARCGAPGGTAIFVDSVQGEVGEATLKKKLIHQLQLATLPTINNLNIAWEFSSLSAHFPVGPHAVGSGTIAVNNGGAEQAPAILPPVVAGSLFSVFTRFSSHKGVPLMATLSGTCMGKTENITFPVVQVSQKGRTLELLWARTLIRDLEDKGVTSTSKFKLVELGTKYGLMTSQTSFVAVEKFLDGRSGIAVSAPPLPSEVDPGVTRSVSSSSSSFTSKSIGSSATRGYDSSFKFYGNNVQTYSMGGNPTALFASSRGGYPAREDQDRSTATIQVFCTTCKNTGHSEAQCTAQSRIVFPPLSGAKNEKEKDVISSAQELDGSFSSENQALTDKVGGVFIKGFGNLTAGGGNSHTASMLKVWFTLVVVSYMQKYYESEYTSIIAKALLYVQRELEEHQYANPNTTILQCMDWIRPRLSK